MNILIAVALILAVVAFIARNRKAGINEVNKFEAMLGHRDSPENIAKRISALEPKLRTFREEYRNSLVGRWGTVEMIPQGFHYHFRPDGTGTYSESSGFAGDETEFEWRCVDDWCLELKMHYIDYEEDGSKQEPNVDEYEWDRIKYDFVVTDLGYRHDVVLCEASVAERYRQNPGRVDFFELGLRTYDGPLARLGD